MLELRVEKGCVAPSKVAQNRLLNDTLVPRNGPASWCSRRFIASTRACLANLGLPGASGSCSVLRAAIIKPLTLLYRVINLNITTHVSRSFGSSDLSRFEACFPTRHRTFTRFLERLLSRLKRNPLEPRDQPVKDAWFAQFLRIEVEAVK